LLLVQCLSFSMSLYRVAVVLAWLSCGCQSGRVSVNSDRIQNCPCSIGSGVRARISSRPCIDVKAVWNRGTGATESSKLNRDLTNSPLPPTYVRVKGRSSLTSRAKDIYELVSGRILLLAKADGSTGEMKTECEMLDAIEELGVRVVPHKLVKVRNPKTGNGVWAILQERVPGRYVHLRDKDSPLVLASSVRSCSTAARNLVYDMSALLHSGKAGVKIDDLQRILRPDGHFFLIDPLAVKKPDGTILSNGLFVHRWAMDSIEYHSIASTLELLQGNNNLSESQISKHSTPHKRSRLHDKLLDGVYWTEGYFE